MRHLRALLAALSVLVLPALALGGPAQAAEVTGTVGGTVVVPPGYDVRDVSVVAVPVGSTLYNAYGGTWAAADGSFAITGLAPGEYRLAFGTYNRDMNVCAGNPAWWSGLGQPAVGTCTGGTTFADTGTVTVVSGGVVSLGSIPVLSTIGTFDVHGTVVAPPGHSVAGVKVEVWLRGDGAYSNGTHDWHQPGSVPTVTLDASGAFGFDLIDGYWSDYAIRFVDPSHTYAFSFASGGLDATTPGANGSDFGAGSVGLLHPARDGGGVDLGTLRLKRPLGHTSGGVTVQGVPEWGRTLTAVSNVVWSDPSVPTGFQWYRSGVAIDGATGSSYDLNGTDDGWEAEISVRAVPSGWWAYDGPPIQSTPVTILNTTPFNRAAPAISGGPIVGQALSTTGGSWTPTTPTYTFSYQWLRDGVAIPGATTTSYAATAADAGHRLSTRVSATRPPSCELCSPWFQGPGVADSAMTGVVLHRPVVGLTAKRKGGKARLVVTVTSAGRPLSGKVVLKDGRKRIGAVTLSNGTGRLKARIGKGRHRITASYAASAVSLAGSAKVRLR